MNYYANEKLTSVCDVRTLYGSQTNIARQGVFVFRIA